MLSSFFKARADSLPGEAKQWKIYGTSIETFETEVSNSENDIAQQYGHRIKTPPSKLMILVSSCWGENVYAIMHTTFKFLSLVFLKLLIVGVAFFLGHRVYSMGYNNMKPETANNNCKAYIALKVVRNFIKV